LEFESVDKLVEDRNILWVAQKHSKSFFVDRRGHLEKFCDRNRIVYGKRRKEEFLELQERRKEEKKKRRKRESHSCLEQIRPFRASTGFLSLETR
jgi:hypothetical protein